MSNNQTRLYFHGDLQENTNKYFCARCDSFDNSKEHFSEHCEKGNINRFKFMSRLWKTRPNYRKGHYRPDDANNVFAGYIQPEIKQ